jgi:ribosomal protein L7/L12
MKDLPDLESLSYACISVQPIDYEFSGGNWAEATEGGGWQICEGSILPEDMETEIYRVHAGINVELDIVLDEDTFEIEVTRYTTDDAGNDVDEDVNTYSPSDKEYDALVKHLGLDGSAIREASEAGDADWEPMMNFAYALDCQPPNDWKTKVNCCTVVEIDEKYYLALTGGGMDFSWEICESYMRLGYLPPAHFAALPRMAGRGESELDKWILRGCYRTFEAMKARAEQAMRDLGEMNPAIRTKAFGLKIRGYRQKIAAIKAVRNLIDLGLKEAKDMMDRVSVIPTVLSTSRGTVALDKPVAEEHANYLREQGVEVEVIEL